MTNIIIGTSYSFSRNFPNQPENEIQRDNVISTVEKMLINHDVIFITGEQEIGKSNFLSQFVRKNHKHSLSCFINPINTYGSSIDFLLLDLSAQLNFLLNSYDESREFDVTFEEISKLFLKLSRVKKYETFYIVIDGFEEIDEKFHFQIENFFDNLPLGQSQFKFIISDDNKLIYNRFFDKKRLKKTELPMNTFSLHEIQAFFNSSITDGELQEVRNITNSFPGRLNVIYNLLNKDRLSFSEILSHGSFGNLLQKQVDAVPVDSTRLDSLLGLLAHGEVDDFNLVHKFLNMTDVELTTILDEIPFLRLNINNSIEFISPIFKKFIQEKYSNLKSKIDEALIEYYTSNVDISEQLIELPKRLDRSKKYRQLITMMSNESLLEIFRKKESLISLEEHTFLGIRAAKELNDQSILFNLSLLKSSISEIKNTYVWKALIDIKLELKDYDGALELVNSTPLKEEKFKLMAFISRQKSQQNLEVDPAIKDILKTLYAQIDVITYFSENEITEIITDLLHVFPDIALELVDKLAVKNGIPSDIGFANLILILRSKKEIDTKSFEQIEKNISDKINDSGIKSLAHAFSSLYGNESIEVFISRCEELTKPTEKLQLIQLYLEENDKKDFVTPLIIYSIDVILAISAETPITSSMLATITNPIPYQSKTDDLELIYKKLSPLKVIAKQKGSTIKYIEFLLNLAVASARIQNIDSTRIKDFFDVYDEIATIDDIGTKTEAFSIMYKYICLFDENGQISNVFDYKVEVLEFVKEDFLYLLNNTANHFDMAKPILKHIAIIDPLIALDFVAGINTKLRIDFTVLYILKCYLANTTKLDFVITKKLYQTIINSNSKDLAISSILEKASKINNIDSTDFVDLKFYISKIASIGDNIEKCNSYLHALKILNQIKPGSKDLDTQILEIFDFVKNIDDLYNKIDFGYSIVKLLLNIKKEKAIELYEIIDFEKSKLELDSPVKVTLFYNSLRLLIVAFKGVFKNDEKDDGKIATMIDYINIIPGEVVKLELISKIVYILDVQKCTKLAKSTYDRYLKNFLQSVLNKSTNLSDDEIFQVLLDIAPLAFHHQPGILSEIIKNHLQADHFYDAIIEYILFRRIPNESNPEYKIDITVTLDDAIKIFEILNKMSTDYFIALRLDQLVKAIKNSSFPEDGTIMIVEKINGIISAKLPDLNNIKHMGYVILCNALVLKLSKTTSLKPWEELINEVKDIPNNSDKAFILANVLVQIPSKLTQLKNQVIASINEIISSIKSYKERVKRISEIYNYLKESNTSESRKILRTGMLDSLNDNDGRLYSFQKKFIDLAYEIDSTFADELIQAIDQDPARKRLARNLRKRVNMLSFKNDLVNDEVSDLKNVKQLSEACSIMGVQLANNRIASKHPEKISDWLISAQQLPLSDSYSIFCCYAENINARFGMKDGQPREFTENLFENALKNVQMVKVLSKKAKDETKLVFTELYRENDNHLIVKFGERAKALDFINNWVQREVVDYIKICDPYFTFKDLQLIKDIFLIKPEISFTVIGQFNHYDSQISSSRYMAAWKDICDQKPPELRIILLGISEDENDASTIKILPSPNHDRWYISHNSGLSVGTSYNSLGNEKHSEISIMDGERAKHIEKEIIDKYINRTEKSVNGKKIRYNDFDVY